MAERSSSTLGNLGNPPLVEVFCEFFFQTDPKQEWDSFLVPDFYNLVKEKFPKRQQLKSVCIKLGNAPEAVSAPPTDEFLVPQHRFLAADEKTLVQLGRHLLVVNQLPPYYGWSTYEPTVMECLGHYLVTWKAPTVSRVALHYIDNVVIPEPQFEVAKYFTMFPVIPKARAEALLTNLAMAFEIKGANEGDILAIAFRQAPSSNPDKTVFMLQWDYVATKPQDVDAMVVKKWLEQAHRFTNSYFHAVFTDECWKIFDPKRNEQ